MFGFGFGFGFGFDLILNLNLNLNLDFGFRLGFVCFYFFDSMPCLKWHFVCFWKAIGVGCELISIWIVGQSIHSTREIPKIRFASEKNRNTAGFVSSCSSKMRLIEIRQPLICNVPNSGRR